MSKRDRLITEQDYEAMCPAAKREMKNNTLDIYKAAMEAAMDAGPSETMAAALLMLVTCGDYVGYSLDELKQEIELKLPSAKRILDKNRSAVN